MDVARSPAEGIGILYGESRNGIERITVKIPKVRRMRFILNIAASISERGRTVKGSDALLFILALAALIYSLTNLIEVIYEIPRKNTPWQIQEDLQPYGRPHT